MRPFGFLIGFAALVMTCSVGQAHSPPPADLTQGQLFVPITPCRAFDTHATAPLAAARNFVVAAASGFEAQGGTSGGCGVPPSAGSVDLSLTSSSSTGRGFIAAYAAGMPPTVPSTALPFNPNFNQTVRVRVAFNDKRITLRPFDATTQVTGDITGYYVSQIEAEINLNGSIAYATPRVLSAVGSSNFGHYAVRIDRDVSACALAISSASKGTATVGADKQVVQVFLSFIDAMGQREGIANSFDLIVHC